MRDTQNVTATDNVVELDELSQVTGGIQFPNGGGSTGPYNPEPFPFPKPSPFPFPKPSPTFPTSPVLPLANK